MVLAVQLEIKYSFENLKSERYQIKWDIIDMYLLWTVGKKDVARYYYRINIFFVN